MAHFRRFWGALYPKASDAFGMDRGKIWIAADFDEPLAEFGEYARKARVR